MRQVTNLITEKNKTNLSYYTLFELYISDTNILRFVSNDNPITFDGNSYQPYPINYENIAENGNNEIETIQVSVSNVSREIQSIIDQNELRKCKVKIIIIFKDKIDDTDAKIEDVFYIDSFETSEQTVIFTLSTKFDVMGVQLPGRIYTRTYCRWQFQGAECKYSGADTECNKKLARCIELANTDNFGGFPGIPPKKVYQI